MFRRHTDNSIGLKWASRGARGLFANLVSHPRAGKWSQTKVRLAGPIFACCVIVAGCAEEDGPAPGEIGYIDGFFGGVATEEPTAALIGRDVLTSGGTAADAATAMAFALSVTMPSAASLGGGGSCLVHDASLGLTEAVNFVPTPGTGQGGDRPTAIPALARGMAALHTRYGRLDWRQVVTPAEQLARLGHRVSRAFARDLARAAKPLFADPEARRIFAGSDGQPVSEGTLLIQPDLSTVLGRIRAAGAGVMHQGPFSRFVVDAYNQAGGRLTQQDLTEYVPKLEPTLIVSFGGDEVHFAPPPAVAGVSLAQMWQMLTNDERYASVAEEERPHLLAEVMKRAFADRKNWLAQGFLTTVEPLDLISADHASGLMADYNPGAPAPGVALDPSGRQLFEVISGTSFVVADREGGAVACNLTMFNRFGTGRIAPGTGIMLAAAPTGRGRNPLSLGPMMIVNANTYAFRYAVAASGGPLAPAAAIKISADTLLAGKELGRAIDEPRFLALDVPTQVLIENSGAAEGLVQSLAARGHNIQRFDWLGQVTALHCPNGLPAKKEKQICRVAHDPRGAGLSTVAD